MSIDDQVNGIRDQFPYLFSQYGFRLIFQVEDRQPDRDIVVLESSVCRIMFYLEETNWLLCLGNLEASIGTLTDKRWSDFAGLYRFLTGRELEWDSVKAKAQEERRLKTLALYSRELEPLCDRLFEMFRSPAALAGWKPDYDRFVWERAERRRKGKGN